MEWRGGRLDSANAIARVDAALRSHKSSTIRVLNLEGRKIRSWNSLRFISKHASVTELRLDNNRLADLGGVSAVCTRTREFKVYLAKNDCVRGTQLMPTIR